MSPRVLGGFLLCGLASLMITGCGHAAPPESALTHTRDELAQVRGQVRPYAKELAAALKGSGFSFSPTVLGSYNYCVTGGNRIDYVDSITVRSGAPATMSGVSREITTLLRDEGWQLVNVNFSKVHLALADTNHPLYEMRQHGMKGAANILPYGSDSAGAIIFMHSPCIAAGSLAAQFVESKKA